MYRAANIPITLLVAVLAWLLGIAAPASAEKRVALVIGNSAYVNVARLDNPKNDARLMAETLRGLGFSLVGNAAQLDLDEGALRNAVRRFGDELQGAEVALFYFAGHGVQVRGSNYLVPVGANPVRESDVDFQLLDSNLVLRQMESAGARLNIVILDACRNNPFGGRGLRGTDSGLAQMRAPEGTLISFATQPGNVAQDGVDGNSPYTKALAQTIKRPGLNIFEAFNEVGLAVMQATGNAQQPWVSNSPIRGTFFFAGAPANVVAAQPTNEVALLQERLKALEQQLKQSKDSDVAVATPPAVAPVAPQASLRPSSPPTAGAVVPGSTRAVLYEEDTNDPAGKLFVGSAVWRTETTKPGGDAAVRADVQIPERGLALAFSLRRNTDKALPASHTVEFLFTLPANFAHGSISNVPGVLLKTNEQARGVPLAGLSVKVTTSFFMVGLSAVETDLQRNIQLLTERTWFDIPIVYADGKRAILAFDKGEAGARLLQQALTTWAAQK